MSKQPKPARRFVVGSRFDGLYVGHDWDRFQPLTIREARRFARGEKDMKGIYELVPVEVYKPGEMPKSRAKK